MHITRFPRVRRWKWRVSLQIIALDIPKKKKGREERDERVSKEEGRKRNRRREGIKGGIERKERKKTHK